MMRSLQGRPIGQYWQRLSILLLVPLFLGASSPTKHWYHQQWKEYEKAGRFAEAIPLFTKATGQYPKEAWFYVYLGHSHLKLKRHAEAIPYLKKASRLAPENAGIRRNLRGGLILYGGFLRKGGKLEQALVYFERAVAADPGYAWSHNLLGHALTLAGKHKRAQGSFRKSVRLAGEKEWNNPNFKGNIRLGLKKGTAYFRARGDLENELAYRELGVRVFPRNWENLIGLIKTAQATGSPQRARAVIRKYPVKSGRRILLAALAIYENRQVTAEKTLAEISLAHEKDSDTQNKISRVYYALVADLDYGTRMRSPFQRKLLHYATKAVEAYFEKNPYRQRLSFRAPLAKSFCVRQGAGEISFHYGLRAHYSYDMSRCGGDSTGMKIVAVAPGRVLAVVSGEPDRVIGSPVDLRARANYIRIGHGETVSLYVHLRQHSALVKVGDKVQAGQTIGEVGNSGISTGPHLHFNISNKEGITLPVRFGNIERVTSGKNSGHDNKRGIMLKRGVRYRPRSLRSGRP